ncbi:MAG: hypothetical protein MI673_10280 [Thiotrichales bacterium]|nr:hypothetical protein [Thiotrichales bacterium]
MNAIAEWARTSPADDFWTWAIVLCVIAVLCFLAAYSYFFRQRLFQDVPTSRIRSAAQGYVELIGQGQLLEGPPIISPLTGITCTWYYYCVEEHRGSGKNARWAVVRQGRSDELFLLNDDTGQCVIDPEDASIVPTVKYVWYGNSATPDTASGIPARGKKPRWWSAGSSINIGPEGAFGSISFGSLRLGGHSLRLGGRYRYTEERMHPGDPLYAIGLFRTEGGAGGNFDVNEDVRELLREWKEDTATMLAQFDTNKDGEICMEEWQKAREAALKEVQARHAGEKIAMPTNMMGKTSDKRRPYILSAVPETELVARYRVYFLAGIALFFATGIFTTWLITLRMAG